MERLLITKNGVPYSAKGASGVANSLTLRGEINEIREGSIVAFEKNGTRVTSGGSFTKTDDKVQFALGLPSGHAARIAPLIDTKTLGFSKTVYAAGTAQVSVIGADGLANKTTGAFAAGDVGNQYKVTTGSSSGDFRAGSTALLRDVATQIDIAANTELTVGQVVEVIAAGTPDAWGSAVLASNADGGMVVGTKVVGATYGVEIVDLEKENWERRKYDISLTVLSTSVTNAEMLANIVAAINAHPKASKFLTASVATGDVGIILTGINAGEQFTALPNGLFFGTSVYSDGKGASKTATAFYGTNAQILELERKCNPIEGKTSTVQGDDRGEIWTVPSLVEVGQNYTLYVLTWTDKREVAYRSNNSSPHHKTLNIAIPSGDSTAITAMDNILSDLTA